MKRITVELICKNVPKCTKTFETLERAERYAMNMRCKYGLLFDKDTPHAIKYTYNY